MVAEENYFFFSRLSLLVYRFHFLTFGYFLVLFISELRATPRNQSNPVLQKKYLESPYFRLANIFEAPQSQTDPPKSRARGPR